MAGLSGVGVGAIWLFWICGCCGWATGLAVVFSTMEIVTGCADGATLGIAWACDNNARSPMWIPTDAVAANQIFFFCISETLPYRCWRMVPRSTLMVRIVPKQLADYK